MTGAQGGTPLLNVANALTVLRIALVPVFVVLLLQESTATRLAALLAFGLALATDRVDGEIARSRGLVTTFGTVADPIADKALIGSALVTLSVLGELWWWVTLVILGRELGVTLLRFVVIRRGVIPASRGGKLKTLLQGAALLVLLLPVGGLVRGVGVALMAAAVVVTLVTGVDYVVRALRVWQSGPPAGRRAARAGLDAR